jgi:hypothetical protein
VEQSKIQNSTSAIHPDADQQGQASLGNIMLSVVMKK